MITWDENKRKRNLEKHGIDFADLDDVFSHYMHSEEDRSSNFGESRIKSLCRHGERIVRLIWIDQENSARLISCRNANKYETRIYYENAFFH